MADSHREPPLQQSVYQNIQTMAQVRQRAERQKNRQNRVADAITRFAGSMAGVYAHVVLFGGWIIVNLGLVPGVKPFDPFPFVMLAAFASVEAIFLSTFILVSQNRMAKLEEKRNELNLQITLLSEHEITRLIAMTDAIARKLDVKWENENELSELKRDVPHDKVIDEIEKTHKKLDA